MIGYDLEARSQALHGLARAAWSWSRARTSVSATSTTSEARLARLLRGERARAAGAERRPRRRRRGARARARRARPRGRACSCPRTASTLRSRACPPLAAGGRGAPRAARSASVRGRWLAGELEPRLRLAPARPARRSSIGPALYGFPDDAPRFIELRARGRAARARGAARRAGRARLARGALALRAAHAASIAA